MLARCRGVDYAMAAVSFTGRQGGNILFDDKEKPLYRRLRYRLDGDRRRDQPPDGHRRGKRGTFDYISLPNRPAAISRSTAVATSSLGIVLFEMLTGDVPYHAEFAVSLAVQHISAPIPTFAPGGPTYRPPCKT